MAAGRWRAAGRCASGSRPPLRSLLYTVRLVAIAAVMLFHVRGCSRGRCARQAEIFANLYPVLTIWTLVPKKWTLDNFRALLDLQPFPFTHYVANSLFVAVTVTALSIVVNACAAYVFARSLPGPRPALRAAHRHDDHSLRGRSSFPSYLEMRLVRLGQQRTAPLIIPSRPPWFGHVPAPPVLPRDSVRARGGGPDRRVLAVRGVRAHHHPQLALGIDRLRDHPVPALVGLPFLWPLIAASSPEVLGHPGRHRHLRPRRRDQVEPGSSPRRSSPASRRHDRGLPAALLRAGRRHHGVQVMPDFRYARVRDRWPRGDRHHPAARGDERAAPRVRTSSWMPRGGCTRADPRRGSPSSPGRASARSAPAPTSRSTTTTLPQPYWMTFKPGGFGGPHRALSGW